jgi:Cu+-exporting ATPase
MRTLTIEIKGAHCANCTARLERLLRGASGIRAADVSYAGQFACVTFDPQTTGERELAQLVESVGFSIARTRP